MKSECVDGLHTNYIPSDDEIERIQKDIALQTREFDRLDKLIQDLCVKRDKIGAYLDSHKALISISRRLPRDILQEIFLACLPTDRNAVMSQTEAPLLLCRICSAWRNIAQATPQLWASVHIPFHYVLADKRRMHALADWLQRSAECPLSLSLVGDVWDHGWGQSNISLSSDGVAEISELLIGTFVEVPAPMLELLKLAGDLRGLVDLTGAQIWDEPKKIALVQGEHLREVHLCSLHPMTFKPDRDWDELTHLSISFPSDTPHLPNMLHPLALLKRTPRLVSFEFGPNIMMFGSISEVLVLPFLQRFVILEPCHLDPDSLQTIFENIWMPELRHVVLPQYADFPGAVRHLSRKSPLIEHLCCSLPSFMVIFNDGLATSFLKRVELCDSNPRPHLDELLDCLAPAPGLRPLSCPALTELVVKNCYSLSPDTLQAFLQRQVELGTPLRRLSIWFLGDPEVSYEDCAGPFRVHGLDISFNISPTPWGPIRKLVPSPWIGLGSPVAVSAPFSWD
ncbi:hypothetical protein C8F04DRAFT_1286972, partial [Mycena alexandri]